MKRCFSRRERGQATLEYLLMMTALVVVFASMYGFMQRKVVTQLFTLAAVKILRVYGVR